MRVCSIEGCGKRHNARGWCLDHYAQWKKHGDPLKRVRRVRGTGYFQTYGYKMFMVNGKAKMEHVLVAERALGRELRGTEEVHHVNEIKSDNRPENLVICPSRAYHMLLHKRMRALAGCGHADWPRCKRCSGYGAPETFTKSGDEHRECSRRYRKEHYGRVKDRQRISSG